MFKTIAKPTFPYDQPSSVPPMCSPMFSKFSLEEILIERYQLENMIKPLPDYLKDKCFGATFDWYLRYQYDYFTFKYNMDLLNEIQEKNNNHPEQDPGPDFICQNPNDPSQGFKHKLLRRAKSVQLTTPPLDGFRALPASYLKEKYNRYEAVHQKKYDHLADAACEELKIGEKDRFLLVMVEKRNSDQGSATLQDPSQRPRFKHILGVDINPSIPGRSSTTFTVFDFNRHGSVFTCKDDRSARLHLTAWESYYLKVIPHLQHCDIYKVRYPVIECK
ncbi:hypothetical protein ACFL96_01135 [Thermoproteota archaeon]